MLIALLLTSGITLLFYIIYKWRKSSNQYFEGRHLKHTGLISLGKSLYELFAGKFDFFESRRKLYNQFPNESIFGVLGVFRVYMFRDPEAYKRIAIKDFDHFQDHHMMINERMDALIGNTLSALHGEKWRQMRATLSPAFTGSKIRQMFDLASECADDVVKYFMCKAKNGEKINVEMKEFFTRYANDVIATCSFGIKIDSFANPDNEFYKNGKSLLTFGGWLQILTSIAKLLISKITYAFNLKFIDESISNWFKRMILDTMAIRQEKNIHRPNMINILMEIREGNLKQQTDENDGGKETPEGFATAEESEVGKAKVARKWSDDELIAQCLIFFLAGFEAPSWTLTFAAYELIVNPDIQQKLYEEIATVHEQLNGDRITYDVLQKMKYLDQFISETLRKWPIAVENERSCVRDYVYDDGEKKFKIEKGAMIVYPVFAIQRDPKYYPNPEKFDPDRFSDENKHNIVPGTYTPFGVGPRNCIGSRFALMEMKAILYHLLLNFSLEPNENTQIPLKMKRSLALATEKGMHLELKPRRK